MSHVISMFGQLLVPIVNAGPWDIYCETFGACGSGQEFVHEFAFRAGTLIFMLIGGVSVIAIMWAAIGMSLSVIDEQEREKAKNSIKYAFMGLMFAIMGGAIVQMVAGIVKDFVGG